MCSEDAEGGGSGNAELLMKFGTEKIFRRYIGRAIYYVKAIMCVLYLCVYSIYVLLPLQLPCFFSSEIEHIPTDVLKLYLKSTKKGEKYIYLQNRIHISQIHSLYKLKLRSLMSGNLFSFLYSIIL